MSSANAPVAVGKESFSFSLPSDLDGAVKQAQKDWDSRGKTDRLWKGDASLWTNSDESKWLGWLHITDDQLAHIQHLIGVSADVRDARFDVRDARFKDALLLGMGGSSLCPEVLRMTYGKIAGFPEL